MEQTTLLEIICRIKNLLEQDHIFEAREYTQLEINNLKGITQENCKNTMYAFYPMYCDSCRNINCEDNKNIELNPNIKV